MSKESLFFMCLPTLVICHLFLKSCQNSLSLWFLFAFPWWLMILRTFSCICWPFVGLLCKYVCLGHLSILKSIYLWVIFLVIEFYSFHMYLKYQLIGYLHVKYFLLFCRLLFHFVDCFLWRSFLVWCISLHFLLLLVLLVSSNPKCHCQDHCQGAFSCVFP